MSDPQKNITGFWNSIASGYEEHPGNVVDYGSPEYEAWVEVIASALPAESSDVLDVATGTGFIALIAAALGHRVTGVDLSAAMLNVARSNATERALNVRFDEGDAVDPPFAAESFDVVTNRHLLWTLREPLVAMRNWRRLLRSGGRLVVIDGFWSAAMGEDPDGRPGDSEDVFGEHYTAETRSSLPLFAATDTGPVVEMLHEAGFDDVDTRDLPQFTFEGMAPYLAVAVV